MGRSGRFACPSLSLELAGLLRKSQRAFWSVLTLALLSHLLALRVKAEQKALHAARPLTTKFVKRQPRLTKPLEMKKRPRPRRRQLQRRMITVQARARSQLEGASATYSHFAGKLGTPSAEVHRAASLVAPDLELDLEAAILGGAKEAARHVDMSLEMIDIGALDTGQYQAMIIQDPTDKRNIKGFVHLARVYSINTPPETDGLPYPDPTALGNLIAAFNTYTGIKADIVNTFTLDDQRLLQTPFAILTCHVQFRLSHREMLNLGKYLAEGGFLLSDDCNNRLGGVSDHCLRTAVKDALFSRGLREGWDWTWEILPGDHPLYHCYFDLDGAPHTPWTYWSAGNRPANPEPEAIMLRGRLVAVHSTWDIVCGWEHKVHGCVGMQYQRVLQLGINMLIFAMTQEGSITHRILAGVTH